MTRKFFSLFFANSAEHERRFLVGTRALQWAISLVETTPGVTAWSFIDQKVPFQHAGRDQEAHVPIAVQMARGRRQLWQVLPGFGGESERVAILAGRNFADMQNCEYVLVTERELRGRPTEMLNRRAAHALLDHASQWKSAEHESYAVVYARERARTMGELQQLLKLPRAEQMHVVFIRAWLRGLLQWDINAHRLTKDLLVETNRV
jgi:hypothetical protein